MLNLSSLRALNLLVKEKVELTDSSFSFLYFKADEEDVTFNIDKKLWSCSCIHESWKGNREESCFHIKSCKYWLKKKGMRK